MCNDLPWKNKNCNDFLNIFQSKTKKKKLRVNFFFGAQTKKLNTAHGWLFLLFFQLCFVNIQGFGCEFLVSVVVVNNRRHPRKDGKGYKQRIFPNKEQTSSLATK